MYKLRELPKQSIIESTKNYVLGRRHVLYFLNLGKVDAYVLSIAFHNIYIQGKSLA